MNLHGPRHLLWLALLALPPGLGCGSGDTGTTTTGGGGSNAGGAGATTGSEAPTSTGSNPATTSAGTGGAPSALPEGWLYTEGNKIKVSDGKGGGTQWMGRGVNVDDLYLCGYNYTLWMKDNGVALDTLVQNLISGWKPNFIRLSLGMASYPTVSAWKSGDTDYTEPMKTVIGNIGKTPGVYVLVTLRSEGSMIGQDTVDGDAEATGLPSDSSSTPDKTSFPTGTDATYIALVDTFAQDRFVAFGLTNEPGGNKLQSSQISAAMEHAVKTIRAEEDKLGVPHHLVSVQGNGWTSDIGFYASAPLPEDNVVYEVHGYPPATSSYTYANLPVIIGEYGSLSDSASFFADLESKQISNLAWDFDSYSDCAPDLLDTNQSSTNLTPSDWGNTVKAYLTQHAQ